MRRIFLPVGPRYSGITTYCEKFVKANASVKLVSIGVSLEELFGKRTFDESRKYHLAEAKSTKDLKELLLRDNIDIILDRYTESGAERRKLTDNLRALGADKIEAWNFTTPIGIRVQWCLKVNEPSYSPLHAEFLRKNEEELYREGCKSFEPATSEQGFDIIRPINPFESMSTHFL